MSIRTCPVCRTSYVSDGGGCPHCPSAAPAASSLDSVGTYRITAVAAAPPAPARPAPPVAKPSAWESYLRWRRAPTGMAKKAVCLVAVLAAAWLARDLVRDWQEDSVTRDGFMKSCAPAGSSQKLQDYCGCAADKFMALSGDEREAAFDELLHGRAADSLVQIGADCVHEVAAF